MFARTTALGFLCTLIAGPALGQTAGMLGFQGLIKDGGGAPVTGTVDLEFRIYDAETAGNLVDMDGDGMVEDVLGEDAKQVLGVQATNGVLSTKFGPVAPSAFDGNPRWLEVSVDGTPLSRVEMATATATAEQVNVPGSGSSAINVDASGNVGIGTTTPSHTLTVDGTGTSGGIAKFIAPGNSTGSVAITSPGGVPGITGIANNGNRRDIKFTDEGISLVTRSTGSAPGSANGITIRESGNVGIGTTDPVAKLHIREGNDASPSGGGFIITGDLASTNIAIDNNEIMARDNGAAAQLRINRDGGTVTIGGNGEGMLGVGTAAPEVKIHVKGGTDVSVGGGGYLTLGATENRNLAFDNNEIMARNNGVAANLFINLDGGNVNFLGNDDVTGSVGIGTNDPQFLLHVDGEAGKPGGGSWSNASDRRLKKNVRGLGQSLGRLLQLRGVRFEYKDPASIHELSGERIGMIAQEVEKTFPDWVHTASDGYKRLTFRGFEALTVEALRELRREKDAQIAELKARLDRMQALMGAQMHAKAGGAR